MKASNAIAKRRWEMKLRRGFFWKKSREWRCMEAKAMMLADRTSGIEKAGGMEAIPSGCRLGKEHESLHYDDGIIEPTFQGEMARIIGGGAPVAEILEKERGTEVTAVWLLGKERVSAMAVYDHPAIPKLPAFYECGIIPPTFQGTTKQITDGFPIAEILEVGITAIGEKEIHGTIKVQCFWVGIKLFDRTACNPQIVHGEDTLELTQPRFGMPGMGPLDIEANIAVGSDEILHMNVSWSYSENKYDTVYNKESKCGKRGSLLRVSYVVYDEAVDAIIKIMFQPHRPVKICGRITSHNNMFPDWKSVLFCKKRSLGENFNVEHDEQLPLLRSITHAPIYNTPPHLQQGGQSYDGGLMIDFNLTNFDDEGTIAQEHLEFPIKKYGNCISMISSTYGVLLVKVTFKIPAEEVEEIP